MTDPRPAPGPCADLLEAARRLVRELAPRHQAGRGPAADRAYYEALAALEAAIKDATTTRGERT